MNAGPEDGQGGGHRALRAGAILAVAGAVIGLDQWSKSWAEHALASGPRHLLGPLQLVLTYNSGAAFSLGRGATPVIEALAIALVALVIWQSGRMARRGAVWAMVIGFGLLCGGALSNLADRFFRHHHGAVVDFIQVATWWPVFNVADAAITVGAVIVAVEVVFFARPRGARSAGASDVAVPKGSHSPAGGLDKTERV